MTARGSLRTEVATAVGTTGSSAGTNLTHNHRQKSFLKNKQQGKKIGKQKKSENREKILRLTYFVQDFFLAPPCATGAAGAAGLARKSLKG